MALYIPGSILCYYLSLVACTHIYRAGFDGLTGYVLIALSVLWDLAVCYELMFIYYDICCFSLFVAWYLNLLLRLRGRSR